MDKVHFAHLFWFSPEKQEKKKKKKEDRESLFAAFLFFLPDLIPTPGDELC